MATLVALAAAALVPLRLSVLLRDIGARLGIGAASPGASLDQAELQVHSAVLAGVSAGLVSPDDLHAVLERAARATRDALHYDSVTVFLLPTTASAADRDVELEAVASAGTGPGMGDNGPYTQSIARGLVGRAARHNEVVLANDVQLEDDYIVRPGTEGVASELCVPIRIDGSAVGVLNVDSVRRRAFSEHDVRTCSILADQMALAISRWRLDRERAARTSELERLKSFNERIVEGIREGIVVADLEGIVSFTNRALEEMVDAVPGALAGQPWRDLVTPEWQVRLPGSVTTPTRFESRLRTAGGGEVAVQVAAQPRENGGTILLFTDISRRVRSERVARLLGETGMAMQKARSEEELFDSLRDVASRTGLRIVVAMQDEHVASVGVSFASLDPRGARVVERALGIRLSETEIPADENPWLGHVLDAPEPVFAPDAAEVISALADDDAQHLAPAIARRLGLGPSLHVPMRLGAHPRGIVAITHPELAREDAAAARVFANQVATAIDRARLQSESAQRRRQVAVLAEAAQQLAATANMEDVATGITEQVRRVFEADAAHLYILDEGQDSLQLAAAPGFSRAERTTAERTAWTRHPGWVLRERQPLLCGDASTDPRVVYIGSRPRFASVMYAPLLIEGDRCVGALGVSSRGRFAWHPNDLSLISTLADQVAVAVTNGLRVRDASRRALQLERVSIASRRVTASLAVPDLLQHAVAETAQVFDATHGSLFLVASDGGISHGAHYPDGKAVYEADADDVAWLWGRRRPIVVTDLRDSHALPGLKMRLIERGVHSLIVVPLVVQDRVVGGLFLYALAGGAGFAHAAQELAQIVGDQLAVAVDNARLFQAALDARTRTEAVVQSSFTAMLTVDTVGRIRDANPAAAELLAAPRESLTGRLVDAVLGADIWMDPDGPVAAARRSQGIVAPREVVLPLRGGHQEREVLMGVAPLSDGYLISMADITRLKELDRLKTELVANVSHELRSPLASIKAYTELLLDGLVPDQETYDEFLGIIDGQADRLGQCIGNLLDLARVEADGYVVRREPFGLRDFVLETVDTVLVRAETKDIDIAVALPDEELVVHGDRPILFSSLKNLVDNAVKYSPAGTEVHVLCEASPEGLTIRVIDDGPGISADDLARIFEKFYRAPSGGDAKVEGSGLGLVIARQAARAHGGDVKVRSERGAGSEFIVRLPASMLEYGAVAIVPADGHAAKAQG